MHPRVLRSAVLQLSFIFMISLCPVFAQTGGHASLYGTVIDSSGASIAGAKVTVTNLGTNRSWIFVSNSDGNYVVPDLPIGQYKVDVEQSGFAPFEATGFTVVEAQNTRADVILQLGTAKETVTVTAGAPLVDTQSQGVQGSVGREFMDELPLIDRNITTLETIAAGTNTNANGNLTTNGVRPGHNEYQLDGISVDNPQFTIISTDPTYPNPDAVQEFTLLTNGYEAQYGRNIGAQVIVATRSGTNQLHGSASDYLRNNVLDAQSFFANSAHQPITPYKRNIFGATLGGPIKKDKLFFFGSYQGTREIATPSAGVENVVPTQAERDGDFSALSAPVIDPLTGLQFPGNKIPQPRWEPFTQNILSLVPLPNGPAGELIYAPASKVSDNQFVGKIDAIVKSKDHLYGSFYIDRPDQTVNDGLPALNTTLHLHHTAVSLHEIHSFTSNLLNDFGFGGIYYEYTNLPDVAGNPSMATFGAKYFIPPGIGGVTPIYTQIIGNANINDGAPSLRNSQLVQGIDNLTWIKGNHTFVFGGSGNQGRTWTLTNYRRGGEFQFNGYASGNAVADFILGVPSFFEQDGGAYIDHTGQDYAVWAQDTWRARRNLTVNIGLRWAPTFFEGQKLGTNSNFIKGEKSTIFPNAPAGLVYQGDPGVPKDGSYRPPIWDVFEPRLGIAWTPFGHSNWVVRSSVGEFHEPPMTFVVDNNLAPPFTYNAFYHTPIPFTAAPGGMENPYQAADISDPFPFTPVSSFAPLAQRQAVTFALPLSLGDYIEPNASVPVGFQWNLFVQHQFSQNDGVEIGYVGSRSYRELYDYDPALAIYIPGLCDGTPCSTETNIQSRRLLGPAFTTGYQMSSMGYANYNALQITYRHKVGYGLTLNANYTYSRSMNIGQNANEDISVIHDPLDLRQNYGPTDTDQPNIINVSYAWTVPFFASGQGVGGRLVKGWIFSGIARHASGYPVTILSGVDNSLSGEGYDYADVVPNTGWKLTGGRSRGQEVKQWFNPQAFTVNAVGTYGDAARNIVRGPGGLTWDVSLFRDFHLWERVRLQYRLDGSNILNHPVLTSVSNTVTSSNFGAATGTGNPRILQMALRVIF
jgi:hypothetical protein